MFCNPNIHHIILDKSVLIDRISAHPPLKKINTKKPLKNVVCVHPQETQRLMAEPVPGITATPDDANARYFHVDINGPQDSPFEGGRFKLELFLPEEYPMAAPKVRFMTKIYHPNVDKLGRICLDILKGKKVFSLGVSL